MQEYFSHDYFSREDEKIKRLLYAHGMTGYGIYWSLVEMLYQCNGYALCEYDRIAFDMRTQSDLVESVICDFGLFKLKQDKFFSDSVLKRLKLREEKSDKARASASIRWDKANAKRTQSERNAIKEKKRKVNNKELLIENSFNFYKNEIEKLKIQPDQVYGKLYFDFCNRLCKKNPDGTWEYYYVLLIKNQVSIVEFIKLYKKSKEDMELIFSKINSLQTKKDYHNKYDDLYLTINNWLR